MNQSSSSRMLILVAVFAVLTVVLGGTTVWYYMQAKDATNNLDTKVAEAVSQAKEQQKVADESEFAERIKSPYETYTVPEIFADISVSYPKNYSFYLDEDPSGTTQLDARLHPKIVRADDDGKNLHALRFRLVDELYTDVVNDYQRDIEDGDINSKAIKVSDIVGLRLSGQIDDDYSGTMVLLPIRDKTFMIWTESDNHIKDFNKVLDKLDIN